MHVSPFMIALLWMVSLMPVRPGSRRAQGYLEIASATVEACDGEIPCMAESVAFAKFESDFTRGARGGRGEIGPWQIMPEHLSRKEKTSIHEQALIARKLRDRSRAVCKENRPEHAMALYTSGDCRWGKRESEHRLALAQKLINGQEETTR